MVIGENLHPQATDDLGWDDLAAVDAVYFTGGDPATLVAARAAPLLVVTARRLAVLAASGVRADVLIGSAIDPGERVDAVPLPAPPARDRPDARRRGRHAGAAADGAGGSWPAVGAAGSAARRLRRRRLLPRGPHRRARAAAPRWPRRRRPARRAGAAARRPGAGRIDAHASPHDRPRRAHRALRRARRPRRRQRAAGPDAAGQRPRSSTRRSPARWPRPPTPAAPATSTSGTGIRTSSARGSLHAPLDSLATTPAWLDERARAVADGGAYIRIEGDPDPTLLADARPGSARRSTRCRSTR